MSLPWEGEAPPPPPGSRMPARTAASELFLCTRHPAGFLATPKCGSTFVKHLFWRIDNAAPHESADGAGTRIHAFDRDLPRGDRVSLEWVRESPHCFVIVREPVDRILSLYWDKLATDRDPKWRWFRRLIADRPGYRSGGGAADHAANCLAMVEWIRANIRGETDVRINNHWRPQQMRINMARTLGLKALPLDRLEDRMFVLLGDLIPDLRARMAEVPWRNTVPRGVPDAEVVTDALRASIAALYWPDAAAWDEVTAGWAGVDLARPDPDAVPRLSLPHV